MRVYFQGQHGFSKRIDEYIACYYNRGDVCILRKNTERKLQNQNIAIKNNQKHICDLWRLLSERIRWALSQYAVYYRESPLRFRKRGVSGMSAFLKIIYRIAKFYKIEVGSIDQQLINEFFSQFKTIGKLVSNGYLDFVKMPYQIMNHALIKELSDEKNRLQTGYVRQNDLNKQMSKLKVNQGTIAFYERICFKEINAEFT
ncbi:MAG TPA: hypothetical protein PKJ08_06810 [Candidatus Cloacimonadota bacterium]|nr:hypothetical protein [Candidatus Cloacimonadota bacterium]HOD54217.1 hypothetical protein [Candidatus Cloacimonadota bacterium]HPM01417.1 hypothetical protein [Candidatus Cloacimonadota bacterium]